MSSCDDFDGATASNYVSTAADKVPLINNSHLRRKHKRKYRRK